MKNAAKLLNSWAPNKSMEKLIDRFNKGVTYTSFPGQEIAKQTVVAHFLTVIKKTRKYQRVYEDWI